MTSTATKHKSQTSLRAVLSGIWHNFIHELKTVFKDRGIVIMMFLGPLAYPLIYSNMYLNETVTDVPIGVIDNSHSSFSGKITRALDGTQNLKVYNHYTSIAEAKQAFGKREIHGIVFIPKDLNQKLANKEQAYISVYSDVSSFMYYRAIYQSCNYTLLSFSKNLQLKQLAENGTTGEPALEISDPMPYESVSLFNPGGGFASFILPAILVIIIFQTLFLSITMLSGTAREENKFHELVSSQSHRGRIFRVIAGKSIFYFLTYSIWIFYALNFIPHIFNLPHLVSVNTFIEFMLPFLLSSIFFSMTVSVFMPNRETSMILFMFFSLILLFLSGITWPESNIGVFWKVFSWIFPTTHGIQGYIKINTMGASIHLVKREYLNLWILTGGYFLLTTLAYRWQINRSNKRTLEK